MIVTHYQRKPRAEGNYSLEAIFADVRARLQQIETRHVQAPFLSNGLTRRVLIVLHAWWNQRGLMHVTGDITFATLLLKKKRTILTILDCIGADRGGVKGWFYRKLWIEWPVSRAAYVTTISSASKSDIVKYARCRPEKVIVTGVAISHAFQRSDKPFNRTKPRLLQIGAAHNKNIERLAEAIQGLTCELRIIGKINDSQRNALVHHGIDFTEATGLTESELIAEYQQCDIVTFVSTFEGFGMPILEGNAIGRPVITGNCTSMPEVAGNAACLVDPLSATAIRQGLIKIFEDDAYRCKLVENGFENVKRFHAQEIAENYLRVYQLTDASRV